jgi:outer membrane protein TolC
MRKSGRRALALAGANALLLAMFYAAFAGDLTLPPSEIPSADAAPCEDGEPVQPLGLAVAVAQTLNLQPQLLIAEADELASRSDLKAATAGFLPQIDLSAVDERYVPSNGSAPVVVVDNTVLGGAQTKSAYASLSLQWNLWSDGRDVAAYRGAKAGIRAAAHGVDRQLDETLIGVLKAYVDLYAAEVTARSDAHTATALAAIRVRAQKRYARGYGTEVAVGQTRIEALNATQTLNGACRDLEDKSAVLAETVGLEMGVLRRLSVAAPPEPLLNPLHGRTTGDLVGSSPAVAEAQENMVAARMKLHQALGEFGPKISLSVQRDYLGQDPDSFGRANHHIAPADYRVGLEFQQPLFPLASEGSDVDRTRAELRKAEASYRQAVLDVQTKLAEALSARREAERSYAAAQSSLTDAEQVLELTEAQYRAGRKDLDAVEHARMDRNAAEADLEKLSAQRVLAEWTAEGALFPREFPAMLLRQLHLEVRLPTGE